MQIKRNIESRVSLLLSRRSEFLQLVVVAALLAIGVNITSDYLLGIPLVKRNSGIIGAAAITLALVWVLLITFRERTAFFEYEGAFLFDEKTKRILEIPDYEFGEELPRTLNAVFAENKALEQAWFREPLVDLDDNEDSSEDDTKHSRKRQDLSHSSKSEQLFREALEYVLLESLSLHLSDYFNDYHDEDQYIRRYKREDIPHLLLQNRILSLLSSPFEDRPIFSSEKEDDTPGEICMIYGEGGAIYNRFELVLPKETVIKRPKVGHIELESKRLHVALIAEYEGYASILPPFPFIRLVLGENPMEVHAQKIRVSIRYSVKPLSLILRSGWQYYEWVDSFANDLRERFSINDFLQRINWSAVELQSRILKESRKVVKPQK